MANARSNKEYDFHEDEPKLAPNRLPTPVKMAIIKQRTAENSNVNQTSREMPSMKFDHVFAASKLQEDTPRRIIFTDTVKKEGSSWFDNEAGVWIKFSSKAVSDPRLITCSMWKSGVVSPPLEENEALVSNVIELACDEPDGINFSGVTVALSHSATDLGGYELAMKELMDSENKTWKDLETTKVSDLSDHLHENSESQSKLPFLQGKITSFSLYAVICRLKTYTFVSSTSVRNTEFTCQVPEYPDLSVTIPRLSLSKELMLTMKVQQVPRNDSEERKVFVGPILHISSSQEVELTEPASISIPISLEQDQIQFENLTSKLARIFYCDTKEKSQEWVEITRQLKTPAKLEKGVVTFQVNHFSKYVTIWADSSEEINIQGLLKRDSSVPQIAGFLASLCDIRDPVEHLLVLCCFPLHMQKEVWMWVSSRYNVVRQGQDTSRYPLCEEDQAFFYLPDGFTPLKEKDKETNFLKFAGHGSFETCVPVRIKKTESCPQIRFFKQNRYEETLCSCTLSIIPTLPSQGDLPSTSQDMSGYFAALLERETDLVTPEKILDIQDDVGSCWLELGIKLDIKPASKVRNLERDYTLSRDRAHKVLEIWMEQKANDATMGHLACALLSIGKKSIADKLLGKQSKQPTERKEPDDIFSLFAEVKELRKIVAEQEKTKKEVEKKNVEELKEMVETVKQMKGQVQRIQIEMEKHK